MNITRFYTQGVNMNKNFILTQLTQIKCKDMLEKDSSKFSNLLLVTQTEKFTTIISDDKQEIDKLLAQSLDIKDMFLIEYNLANKFSRISIGKYHQSNNLQQKQAYDDMVDWALC